MKETFYNKKADTNSKQGKYIKKINKIIEGNSKRCKNIYCDVMLEEMRKNVFVQQVERHKLIKNGIIEEFNDNKDICEEYPLLYSIIAYAIINNIKVKKLTCSSYGEPYQK